MSKPHGAWLSFVVDVMTKLEMLFGRKDPSASVDVCLPLRAFSRSTGLEGNTCMICQKPKGRKLTTHGTWAVTTTVWPSRLSFLETGWCNRAAWSHLRCELADSKSSLEIHVPKFEFVVLLSYRWVGIKFFWLTNLFYILSTFKKKFRPKLSFEKLKIK